MIKNFNVEELALLDSWIDAVNKEDIMNRLKLNISLIDNNDVTFSVIDGLHKKISSMNNDEVEKLLDELPSDYVSEEERKFKEHYMKKQNLMDELGITEDEDGCIDDDDLEIPLDELDWGE
ncbi:MAG: GTPase-activating protein [Lachnospiraceae bacterium]|nr:GTPase-activating protein [Lachnospiraceae bacterium]